MPAEAELIRVESLQFPDQFTRGQPRPSPAQVASRGGAEYPKQDPGNKPWERRATWSYSGRHKRSVTIDLQRPSKELDGIVGEWTAPQSNYDVFHRLQAGGIPATPVLGLGLEEEVGTPGS